MSDSTDDAVLMLTHVKRRKGMEAVVQTGMVEGKRARGRQKNLWMRNLNGRSVAFAKVEGEPKEVGHICPNFSGSFMSCEVVYRSSVQLS
ncbi:hypothetical protein E2C01_030563 [Portunus trituberculatus]|uniref:Uncharacterized protein n=1 Tax=Portunus trituberculatus TaxID=210409 RepID=A0A5B7EQR7_PORTR|nr:hypothetical protein [Portunus trituberculatus]